ncbi:MAG: hypothetical protein LBH38_03060 [Holosporales bacterium]|jgi:predicted small lipoprotein YifL|nr:hypothetical protein [Holosporales bacterium]
MKNVISYFLFLSGILLLVSACGKRGGLIPPEPEPIAFPRQYPAPLSLAEKEQGTRAPASNETENQQDSDKKKQQSGDTMTKTSVHRLRKKL